MKKARRYIGLFLASVLSLSNVPTVVARADSDVTSLKVSVVGEGTVVLDDYESKYSLESGDIFSANCTVDTQLKISLDAKDGSSIDGVTINGELNPNIPKGNKSSSFDYAVPLSGADITIKFAKDEVPQTNGKDTTVENNVPVEESSATPDTSNTKKEEESKTEEKKPEDTKVEEVKPEEPNKVETILNEYFNGNYNSTEAVNFRKELVAKHKLEDKVNDDFFFKKEYLSKLVDLDSVGDCITLVKISKKDLALEYLQNGEVDKAISEAISSNKNGFFKNLLSKLFSSKETITVTNHGSLSSQANGVLSGYTNMISLNGRMAFPTDFSKVTPSNGMTVSDITSEENEVIRKVLYYGFGGPSQLGGWDANRLRIATSIAISNVRNNESIKLGAELLNQVAVLPEPPVSFKTYIANIEDNKYQDLAFWVLNENTESDETEDVVEITKDFDYSNINRTPWKDIDWSKYGGSGIDNPELLSYLNSVGINPHEDEDYGMKLEEVTNKAIAEQSSALSANPVSSVDDWYVGQVISGLCDITYSWFVPSEGQSYFTLGNFRGGLSGIEQVGSGWCADHTAAEPPAGHPITSVSATVTSIDTVGGWVNFSGLVIPYGVTNGSSNGNGLIGYQRVAFQARMKVDVKGGMQILKESSDPSITNGNSYYSLANAQYTIYSDPNAVHAITTVTTDSAGWSAPVYLNAGTYYVMETKAPKGFALDNTVYPVTVTAGQTTTRTFTDKPQFDPVGVLLKKVDADTGNAVPVPGGTLADAQFTFKFYAGEYADGVNPADLGVSPTRTWIMKTDEYGFTMLDNSYKVSGDPLYIVNGSPTLPLGTVTIQETKAPIGYKINPQIFVRRITPNGVGESVNTYNEPIIREESLSFIIKKVQSGTSLVIPNAKFRHTKPDGSSETVQTGSNGEVALKGLTQGVHTLVEIDAPEGYKVNTNEFKFEVLTDNSIRVLTNTTNLGMSYATDKGNGILTVEDDLNPYSLKISKVNDKGAILPGAEFTLYSDKDCQNVIKTLVTDSKGELKFTDLKVGTKYYFKETKAPQGYRIPVDKNGNVHVYELYVESKPVNGVFDFYIDGIKYTTSSTSGDIHLEGTKDDRVVSVKVVNSITMQLPETGSNTMIPLLAIGTLLMMVSIVINRKSNRVIIKK